jgi:hypothetical protein
MDTMSSADKTIPCKFNPPVMAGLQYQQDVKDLPGHGEADQTGGSKVMNIIIMSLVVTVLIVSAILWMSTGDAATYLATVSWNG